MRIVLFIALALCLFVNVQSAAATSPCISQTAEEFQEMKAGADLIVHAKIIDYHTHNDNPHAPESWTDVEVLNVYQGEESEKTVRLHGWTSYFMPLYVQDKGSEAVFMLKKSDDGYHLADLSWKKCVPAVIGLPATFPIQWNGKTYTREEFIEARLSGMR